MTDQADKAAGNARVWKANYSETGKLRGGPCVWLYNPKGEAVVLMFPQDRPEAEGVVPEIVNGLNAALSAQEPKVCHVEIERFEDFSGCEIRRSCGIKTLVRGSDYQWPPASKYCDNCGLPIEVKEG